MTTAVKNRRPSLKRDGRRALNKLKKLKFPDRQNDQRRPTDAPWARSSWEPWAPSTS